MKYIFSLPQLKIFSSINFGCGLRRQQACPTSCSSEPAPYQANGRGRLGRTGRACSLESVPPLAGPPGVICLMGMGSGVTSMPQRAAQYVVLIYSFSGVL